MHEITRRRLLKGSTAAALATGLPRTGRAGSPVTIGYITPQTGPLSLFGEADAYVINTLRPLLSKRGITLEVRNTRSDSLLAASQAVELINNNVPMILVSSTAETTNPVSDQCELAGVPCISTLSPWQSWFFDRGGDPDTGFVYTYHFFWGLEDIFACYTGMWAQLATNKTVGTLFPNDRDGISWGDSARGFPPALAAQNFKWVSSDGFFDMEPDFSAQISAFESGHADIITGVLNPADFVTFWAQARKRGMAPRILTIGKALLFPQTLEGLGDAGHNLSTEVWWAPSFPYKSSLTGQTAAELAAAYVKDTGKQWTQPLGFAHALCELAVDVIGRASDPTDPDKVLEALIATSLRTVVGTVDWDFGPVKNVCKTPVVGGQWRTGGGEFKYEVVITQGSVGGDVPAVGTMQVMT